MNVWDIIKTVGSAVVSNVVPGGGAIIDLVNTVLPEDKKLPVTATGDQVRGALSALPPEQQSAIMNKQFDVDIAQIQESGSTLRAMLESEAKAPHTTRPKIALGAFYVVATISLTIVFGWLYAVIAKDAKLVGTITGGWPFVAAATAPFIALLRA